MLKTLHLTYTLRGKHLIQNISLDFQPGQLYAILGPNGSGKSTFLKTLTGIWKPTKGNVYWEGEDLLKKNRKQISRTLSLVPQSSRVNFDYLIEDIVYMGRYPHGEMENNKHIVIEKALRAVDAWHLRGNSINCLSAGEKQRIYIARALATESPILLLDEPTTNLDIRHQLEIWELLKILVSEGQLVIVTTHDLTMAQKYCEQIAVLNQGQCVAQGSFSKIMTPALLNDVFGV